MKNRNINLATTIASLVLIGGSSGAADPTRVTVVLHVIDHTGTTSTIMAQARSHAERVFGAIGVHVVWSDRADGSCGGPDFVVTFLPTDGALRESRSGEMDENLVFTPEPGRAIRDLQESKAMSPEEREECGTETAARERSDRSQ